MLDNAGHKAEVDAWVNDRLVEEGYADLLAEETHVSTEARREQLREMLSGGEDYRNAVCYLAGVANQCG
ncbi:MAG TPA: hypothetical protein VE288_09620 [Rubrobacteraceae bacterium]|jgi:hypothetical protein|nr:hypothetical protein [Rubrobacteraceae bacterium]